MNIRRMQALVHENAKAHGWWDEPKTFGEQIALCHSELSEALEDYRNGHKPHEWIRQVVSDPDVRNGDAAIKPCGIPSELADVVIRVMDMCHYYGIDLEAAIIEKHRFNTKRSYKHGGKVL